MNNTDSEYFRLVDLVLSKGQIKNNRTGVDTLGVFGAQARFNLQEGFPLLTTKKVFMKAITHELLWFLSGSTNIKYLVDNGVKIWDDWAYAQYKNNSLNTLSEGEKHWDTINSQGYIHQSQDEFIANIKNNSTFAEKWGELGEGTYGGMWRKFPYEYKSVIEFGQNVGQFENKLGAVDQIQKVLNKLKTNPDDRRLIVSAWHPYWVDHCALPPCHVLFQFHTEALTDEERMIWMKKHNFTIQGKVLAENELPIFSLEEFDKIAPNQIPKRRLNCQLYQRSCDLGLGVPFNIASYALLTHMVAQVSNMVAGDFIHTYGDLHIYTNHLPAITEQRTRIPIDKLPRIELNPAVTDLFQFKFEDIKLVDYVSHPAIKMEVAV